MMNNTAQLNITAQRARSGYIRAPYAFFRQMVNGRRPRTSLVAVRGLIYSFSNTKGDPDAALRLSLREFGGKIHYAKSTIVDALNDLRADELFVQDKSDPARAAYTSKDRVFDKSFIRMDLFLFTTKFRIKKSDRSGYLTDAAKKVLSLFITHCTNPKGDGAFHGSVRGIANLVGLCNASVQKAIKLLFSMELIFRPEDCRGVNGHWRSTYKINGKLLRTCYKAYKKEEKTLQSAPQSAKDKEISDADIRADRERFYAARQAQANARAEHFKEVLNADPKYHELRMEHAKLDPEIARAECSEDRKKAEKLNAKKKSLAIQIARRMRSLGISKEDLRPVFSCNKCRDTGFRIDTGIACDCYPGISRRRSP